MVTVHVHLGEESTISGVVITRPSGGSFASVDLGDSSVFSTSPTQLDEIAATATRLANELRAAQGAKTEAA